MTPRFSRRFAATTMSYFGHMPVSLSRTAKWTVMSRSGTKTVAAAAKVFPGQSARLSLLVLYRSYISQSLANKKIEKFVINA
jgi:glucosamine 6-phosphate synthetase-like amidotransferase/phosphosugar isomerase protein